MSEHTGDYAGLTDEMRRAADLLDRLNGLYACTPNCEWSPSLLRTEAEHLDRPISC